jgi:RNA polymerase sporulation-specific sigma factor
MKANEKEFDIEKTLELVRMGDQQAFSALLTAYEPLLRAEVSRAMEGVDRSEADDFRQIALLALYRAALNFDLSQNEIEFGLYAKICIRNALATQRRLVLNRNLHLTGEEMPFEGDEGVGDPAQILIEDEAFQALLARIRCLLSAYENRVWNLYMAGLSAKYIARAVGKDVHSIENAVYRIRRKLRLALGKGD